MSDDRLRNIHEDYKKIRDEMYEILSDAKDALKLAKTILEDSEHPRAVETYSGLLKNVANIQSQILELTKTYKDIIERKDRRDGEIPELPKNETKNFFIGTTKDLQNKLLEAGLIADHQLKDVTPDSNE